MSTHPSPHTRKLLIARNLVEAANKLSSASLHEAAGRVGALPAALKPLTPSMRLCGPALPITCPPGDNLILHQAIYEASAGDVLVVDAGGAIDFGYWGEIMTAAACARGVGGLVIAGGVRDSQRIIDMGFPVFCAAVAILGTGKNPRAAGSIGKAARIGEVVIHPGDLVRGDADGVVVVSRAQAPSVIDEAIRRDEEEQAILSRLSAGETTLAIFGLPGPSSDRPEPSNSRRRSTSVEGLCHGHLPIPSVSRVGNLVATGGVGGRDPVTGAMPEKVSEQANNMFGNLARILEAAGSTCDDVVKVTIWIATPAARQVMNEGWLRLFPDAGSRPARHILAAELAGGMLVQCEALAFLKGTYP